MTHRAVTPLALTLAAGIAHAAPPRVIYSEIPGDPTAVCPGTGGKEFTGLLELHTSFDGNWWIFKGFIDDPENDVIVYGDGTDGANGALAAWEAMPTGLGDGTSHNFLDSSCGINDSGEYAYGSRLDGATSLTDEIILASNDVGGESVAFRESDPAPGLADPGGAGDEIFGNSLNSPSRLNDGTVCVKADQIENILSSHESACYIGAVPVAQEGEMSAGDDTYGGFSALGGNYFDTSASGLDWIVEADVDPSPLASVEAVVVNGNVQIQDGDTLPGAAAAVDGVFGVRMTGAGNWVARGDVVGDDDWVAINLAARGAFYIHTGDPITTGSAETWGASVGGVNASSDGSYIISGNTSNPDTDLDNVMVLNSETVILREGDPVDLDGNGVADDDVEVNSFSPNDLAINPDGDVIAFITLRQTSTGTTLGDAFIVIDVETGGPCSAADLAEPFGQLDFSDVTAFLVAFSNMEAAADLAAPTGQWDFSDVVAFLGLFAAGCP